VEPEDAAPAASAVSEATPGSEGCPTLTMVAYDSFLVSEGIFDEFTADTCVKVEQVLSSDTGTMVSSAILTKDNPTADVMYGIDNTFLQRGLDADLFESYES